MPLPQPRVDLHQPVSAVAGVALELDLREAGMAELAEEPQSLVDDLLDPDRFADTARSDPRRGLPELAAAEEAERLAVRREVAAERVELIVATGDQLLNEGLVLIGLHEGLLDLGAGLAAERLAAEAPLEALCRRRLHEHRIAELVRGRAGRRPPRHGDPRRLRRLELAALGLDPRKHFPGRERVAEALAELRGPARDCVQRLVMGREDGDRSVELVREPTEEGDERLLILRIG